ncbi:MAG: argininosuccinate lyase [Nitrososphaerota archaeon]|nr:argininosuccinate lyase [Nitrososphaerota archaeon]
MSTLLRDGRLGPTQKDISDFISSRKDDARILKQVVRINKAHVMMLTEEGIISEADGKKILGALRNLDEHLKEATAAEDIHMAVEEAVIEAVGMDVGGNLNIAKSRNDQVATAIRMQLREELLELVEAILCFEESLLIKAQNEIGTIIPGYTHLQPAQPTTFAHYLVAQFDTFSRNLKRLREAYERVDLCPMGSGALATTSFPINREKVANMLGFNGLVENSFDAVSSRDFILEVLAALSIMAVDLSRLAEDLIVWSSADFGIIDLPDEFTSTSSIMPQKKNPDVLEVIRARMGLIIGNFFSSAIVLKSLPSSYNLDFQEITPKLWDSIDEMKASLRILTELMIEVKVKPDALNKPHISFTTATELANILVRKCGIPFRVAHKIVGAAVKRLIEKNKSLHELTIETLKEISEDFWPHKICLDQNDIKTAIDQSTFIESHRVKGGPAKDEVKRMIESRLDSLNFFGEWAKGKKRLLDESAAKIDKMLESMTSDR